jgi:hypothetical protein
VPSPAEWQRSDSAGEDTGALIVVTRSITAWVQLIELMQGPHGGPFVEGDQTERSAVRTLQN